VKSYQKLLLENKAWAAEKVDSDPDYFNRLANVQKPEFLWIGCSDSRVPANEITGTQPGEIFVHRNIANMVIHTDVNLLSVLDYAVNHLKVKHVIVCGHYGCGGVKASMTNTDYKAVLNMWLRNIKDVYRYHRKELDSINDTQMREDRLVELNVQEGDSVKRGQVLAKIYADLYATQRDQASAEVTRVEAMTANSTAELESLKS